MSSPTKARSRRAAGYHHGDLRAALLLRAEEALRTTSVRDLSLRELARDVGVSHAAPRRHFADKDALLAALAEEGFNRLGHALSAAIDEAAPEGSVGGFEARLAAVGRSYVAFAVQNGALLDLMFARKHEPGAAELQAAAERAIAAPQALLAEAQRNGEIVDGDLETLGTVVVAGLHGLAAMAGAGMIDSGAAAGMVAALVHHVLLGLRPR